MPKPISHSIGLKVLNCWLFVMLTCIACNPKQIKTTDDGEPEIIESGGSKDENGCLSSGGYSWSVALEKCVRLWEVGIELTNARYPNATQVAYLIIDPEKDKAELYLPELTGSLLLTKTSTEWVDSDKRYILTRQLGNQYQVSDTKGTLLYQSKP